LPHSRRTFLDRAAYSFADWSCWVFTPAGWEGMM
jgi:hypothetical protein